ncbi:MAG: ankyrin repeat domain-containing protein [Cyanobacteria bacterium P01_C01_bin.38]
MNNNNLFRVIAIWIRRLCVLGIWITIIKNQIPNSTTKTLKKICRNTTLLKQYLEEDGNPDARFKNFKSFDSRNYSDTYPLLFCVSNEGVEILLKHGANPDIKFGSQTLLYKAYMSRNIILMELLLKHGANPNHLTTYKITSVLHDAAVRGKEEIVELLLKNGADVNIKNYRNETPLDVAAQQLRLDTVEILLENGGVTNTELGSQRLELVRKMLHERKLERYYKRLREIKQQQQSSSN